MRNSLIQKVIGDTDIYLVDQILKGRYRDKDMVLDAGCGTGRNMHWFLHNDMCIYGIDSNAGHISELKNDNPALPPMRLQVARVELMPFSDNFFHHIISNAVLHFAESTQHFYKMFAEMVRVLKPGGSLFVRMAADIGIETKVKKLKDGTYLLPDTTNRFLLTRSILENLVHQFPLSFLEPMKIVNVNDVRCMSTLVFQKTSIPNI